MEVQKGGDLVLSEAFCEVCKLQIVIPSSNTSNTWLSSSIVLFG